jgi:hypothetical protein
MLFSMYPINGFADFAKNRIGRLSLVCISLVSFFSKLNRLQSVPVVVLCTALLSTPFPVWLVLILF